MSASPALAMSDFSEAEAHGRPGGMRAWLAISAGTIGAFMALLDTSIANSALPVIQGEIGATTSEATWIGTAYLTTEIVIIPLTAWLERLLGMRRMLLFAATVFTVFSVVCGSAESLPMMIIGRLGQGISGGMMLPTAYSLVARLLPLEQQSRGIAIISGPILAAPIIGPLLGGWLTEHYGWHLAFFINVPICLVLIVLLFAGVDKTKGDISEWHNADWFGVAGMIVGLGSLTVMLEEGHREQWFESPLIWYLAFGTVVGVMLITIGQLRPGRPVLKLSLVANRLRLAGMLMLFIAGVLMFNILFCTPQFLVVVAGMNSYQAGQIILAAGFSSFAMMFVYPTVMRYCDLRLIVGLAMAGLAWCCYLTTGLSVRSGASEMLVMQAVMGGSLAMVAIPLQQITVASVAAVDAAEMTSLVTIFRNIGGSIGLAALASFQEGRVEFHHWRLWETIGANDPGVSEAVASGGAMLGTGPDPADAGLRLIDAQIMRESLVMSFNDIFMALTVLGIAAVPLAMLLRARLPDGVQMATH